MAHHNQPPVLERKMRAIIGCLAIILALAAVTPANAKGCLKGAVVGGVAGHYTVHHGLLGAAAGCGQPGFQESAGVDASVPQ